MRESPRRARRTMETAPRSFFRGTVMELPRDAKSRGFVRADRLIRSFGRSDDIPNLDGAGSRKVEAWFLGPKGENADEFERLVVEAVRDQAYWRRNYHPSDPTHITDEIKRSPEYLEAMDALKDGYRELPAFLKKSVPFFSMRYQGHMNWETTIPGALGYFAAMLYNPNNVAFEGSTATTILELLAGDDLCRMLGYQIPKDTGPGAPTIRPWGHITCDGTVANIEALWSARNLKFQPLAIREALARDPALTAGRALEVALPTGGTAPLVGLTQWQLFEPRARRRTRAADSPDDGIRTGARRGRRRGRSLYVASPRILGVRAPISEPARRRSGGARLGHQALLVSQGGGATRLGERKPGERAGRSRRTSRPGGATEPAQSLPRRSATGHRRRRRRGNDRRERRRSGGRHRRPPSRLRAAGARVSRACGRRLGGLPPFGHQRRVRPAGSAGIRGRGRAADRRRDEPVRGSAIRSARSSRLDHRRPAQIGLHPLPGRRVVLSQRGHAEPGNVQCAGSVPRRGRADGGNLRRRGFEAGRLGGGRLPEPPRNSADEKRLRKDHRPGPVQLPQAVCAASHHDQADRYVRHRSASAHAGRAARRKRRRRPGTDSHAHRPKIERRNPREPGGDGPAAGNRPRPKHSIAIRLCSNSGERSGPPPRGSATRPDSIRESPGSWTTSCCRTSRRFEN